MAYVLLHSIKGFDLYLCKKIDEKLWRSQHFHKFKPTLHFISGKKWFKISFFDDIDTFWLQSKIINKNQIAALPIQTVARILR